jgi:quercetin dioxygenase-like cupin family protein
MCFCERRPPVGRPFSENIVRSTDRSPIELSAGVQRRTLVWGQNSMLAEWRMKAGTVIPADQNPEMEEVAYVVSGQVEVHMGDETMAMRVGSAFVASFRTEHRIRALEDSVVMIMFSPPQEDWKP